MFVCWKKRKLQARNDGSDVECLHEGPERWAWTPIVSESVWTPTGSRRRTVFRPSPAIRSCCMQDPVVRVRWWNATADELERAMKEKLSIDIGLVTTKLTERVPMPTDEDLLIHDDWPHDTPWLRSYGAWAHVERAQVARTTWHRAVELLRPGDAHWQDAVEDWRRADAAFACGRWSEYELWETAGIEAARRAIPRTWQRTPPAAALARRWVRAMREHVSRLEERRLRRDEDAARGRADEERRHQREADQARRRVADEARRHAERQAGEPPDARSVVERMYAGSAKDWAALLGLTYPCTREALKRAHREAVLRHHPDRGGDPR